MLPWVPKPLNIAENAVKVIIKTTSLFDNADLYDSRQKGINIYEGSPRENG